MYVCTYICTCLHLCQLFLYYCQWLCVHTYIHTYVHVFTTDSYVFLYSCHWSLIRTYPHLLCVYSSWINRRCSQTKTHDSRLSRLPRTAASVCRLRLPPQVPLSRAGHHVLQFPIGQGQQETVAPVSIVPVCVWGWSLVAGPKVAIFT